MKKLDDIYVSIDNKGACDGGGITYTRDTAEALAAITEEYGGSAYALDTKRGCAVIITDAGEEAGVDIDLDMAGYTVVAI